MPPSEGARGTNSARDFFGYGQWRISTKAPFFYISYGDQYDPSFKRGPNPYSDDPVLEPPPQKGSWVGYKELRKREKEREARMMEREDSVKRRLSLAKEAAGGRKGRQERVMEAKKVVAAIEGESLVGEDKTIVGEDRTHWTLAEEANNENGGEEMKEED